MVAIDKYYLYKIYRNGVYLGLLNQYNITSDFNYTQQINTGFAQMQISIARSPDVVDDSVQPILDEAGNNVLDETDQTVYEESRPDIFGSTDPFAPIQNDNQIKVYEISSDDPNGQLMFDGWITAIQGEYGGNDNIVITCLSRGCDLGEYIVSGSPYTLDVSQASSNQTDVYSDSRLAGGGFRFGGQTFTTGLGVTNLAAIELKLQTGGFGPVGVSVKVYTDPANVDTPFFLGQADLTVNASVDTVYRFTFTTPITVSPQTSYFFIVVTDQSTNPLYIAFSDADPYAPGDMYIDTSVAFVKQFSEDLWFKTYSNGGATTAAFNVVDPSTGIVEPVIDTYFAQGGAVNYAAGSVDATGLVFSYSFITATTLEAIKKALEASPAGFYWYVDPGSLVLYFKLVATTATHKFIKGRHLSSIKVLMTTDNIRNLVYFTGGNTGGGSNLYTKYERTNTDSSRQRLERLNDNRVVTQGAADTLVKNFLDGRSSVDYNTPITIPRTVYDISTINLGDTVGFEGFGPLVNSMVEQIVQINRYPDYVELFVGKLPFQQSKQLDKNTSDILQLATIANPSTPS